MLNCFYIGAALYCGSAGGPVADIQQPSPPYPTEYMAQQLSNARRADAHSTTYATQRECQIATRTTCVYTPPRR
jgi:hypothetical protein